MVNTSRFNTAIQKNLLSTVFGKFCMYIHPTGPGNINNIWQVSDESYRRSVCKICRIVSPRAISRRDSREFQKYNMNVRGVKFV